MIPEIGHYALILALCVSVVLTLNPREVPSPLAGKLAPSFVLPQLHEQDKTIFSADMTGKVWLLNFWASWCGGCKEEHPALMRMAKADDAQIYGMDYKDSRHEALTWLRRHGNPYPLTAVEEAGGSVSTMGCTAFLKPT
jgi:cytochrome c biogenesis protein CcmG/thiol:disulfide interchange protein DsbE